MSTPPRGKIELPKVEWRTATCPVCGKAFDYLSRRRPKTCNAGDCRYRFHYGVDKAKWSGYQIGLFDRPDQDRSNS